MRSSLRGTLFPVISASFDASRQMTPIATLRPNAASGADTYSLHTPQVSVSFVPDVFGGTRRAVESAQAQAEAAAFQREAVYTTLASNIALAAIQEASLRGQIAATRRLIEIQTQLLDILRRQNDRGQIALPDVVAQETAVAQARLLLPPLEKQLAQQRNLLATLTGRFAGNGLPAAFELRSFGLLQDCRSACRQTSFVSGRTSASPRPICTPRTRRSASRSPTACRRSR